VHITESLVRGAAEADACDGYVVLVVDPSTGEADAYGPFDGLAATLDAESRRAGLDADGLVDVVVAVTRLHEPRRDAAFPQHAEQARYPGADAPTAEVPVVELSVAETPDA
jgi:hypothetical protein